MKFARLLNLKLLTSANKYENANNSSHYSSVQIDQGLTVHSYILIINTNVTGMFIFWILFNSP